MDKKPATAKAFTDEEKWEIKENGKYILTAMDDIGKNGDSYCTDESLFRVSKTVRPDLTKQQFYMDKSLLLQAAFLHQEGCHLYAQRTWEYEVTAAEQLADILKDPALPVMEIPKELRAGDILLSEQQREAIDLALNSRLAVILGGAGSGKATLIEAIVRCFNSIFKPYVVAAPTGKAARNLTERTGIEARTVHGALGKVPDANFLDAVSWNHIGLVVVDGASMVSLEMLAGILNRVRRNCRVVLLGDPNQLMSVGAGNVLSDLLTLGVPSLRLEQQYRQSADAAALRQNVVDFPKLNDARELLWDDSFRLLGADDRAIPDLLCEEAARRYRAGESIQVLSPVKTKTDFSVQALNTRLQNEVNPLTAEKQTWGAFRDGDRVIVTQNNSYYNICNGDVGVLYIRGEKPHRVATLAVRGTLKTWQIDCVEKYGAANDDAPPPQLALAYALTVHKSQGSQYDAIRMPVSMATAKMLYRNLLYTAISRAGREVILVGNREAVNTAMQCIPYPRKSKLVARTNLLRLGRSA
jgi:exodeoxyribonuclease V alpha subunit